LEEILTDILQFFR